MILAAKEAEDGRHRAEVRAGRHQGLPAGGGARPGMDARLQKVAARRALAWALIVAGGAALWRALIWLSWGLWAVTR